METRVVGPVMLEGLMRIPSLAVTWIAFSVVASGCADGILTLEDLGINSPGMEFEIKEALLDSDDEFGVHFFRIGELSDDGGFPYFWVRDEAMYRETKRSGLVRADPEDFAVGRTVMIWRRPGRYVGAHAELAVLLRKK
jgi:hypothetical protein